MPFYLRINLFIVFFLFLSPFQQPIYGSTLNDTTYYTQKLTAINNNLQSIKDNQIFENDSILNLAHQTLQDSKAINYTEGIYLSYYYIAQIFRLRNQHDSAIYYYHKGLEVPINKKEHLEGYYMQLSNVQRITGNYSSALENALKLKDIVEKQENSQYSYQVYNLLALSYQTLMEYQLAKENFEKSAKLALADSNEAYAGVVYSNIARLLFDQNKLDESLEYFEKGTALEKKYQLNSSLGNSYNIIARIFMRKDMLDSARYYLFQATELNKKANNRIGLTYTLMSVSEYYYLAHNYENALEHLDLTIKNASSINLKSVLSDAYNLRAKIFSAQNKYKQAYENFELFFETYNKIYDFKEINKVKSLEQKLIQQQRESDFFELKLQKQKTINILLIASGGLILIFVIIILIYLFKFKKLNKELVLSKTKAEESDQLKSRFLQTISHEIRTPLNGIVGFSEIICSNSLKESDMSQISTMIHKNSDDLISTIENLVDIAHLSTNQYNVKKSNFEVTPLLSQIIGQAKENPVYKSKNNLDIRLEKNGEVNLYNDKNIVSKIILHLVKNAILYTDKGNITIGYQKDKSEVIFYVKDTGIGIPQEKIDVIFAPFSQGDENLSIKVGGTGLGLTIVNGLVHIIGGKIWVGSELEKGSTFYFSLPA